MLPPAGSQKLNTPSFDLPDLPGQKYQAVRGGVLWNCSCYAFFLSAGLEEINRQAFRRIFKGSYTQAPFPSSPAGLGVRRRKGKAFCPSFLPPLPFCIPPLRRLIHSCWLSLCAKVLLREAALLDVQVVCGSPCFYLRFLLITRQIFFLVSSLFLCSTFSFYLQFSFSSMLI